MATPPQGEPSQDDGLELPAPPSPTQPSGSETEASGDEEASSLPSVPAGMLDTRFRLPSVSTEVTHP